MRLLLTALLALPLFALHGCDMSTPTATAAPAGAASLQGGGESTHTFELREGMAVHAKDGTVAIEVEGTIIELDAVEMLALADAAEAAALQHMDEERLAVLLEVDPPRPRGPRGPRCMPDPDAVGFVSLDGARIGTGCPKPPRRTLDLEAWQFVFGGPFRGGYGSPEGEPTAMPGGWLYERARR